jgi:hypothetical protein
MYLRMLVETGTINDRQFLLPRFKSETTDMILEKLTEPFSQLAFSSIKVNLSCPLRVCFMMS